jgi:DNA-binding response OmpR family regulator
MNAILHETSSVTEAQTRHLETVLPRDILYVEDDAALRNLFGELLFNSGYRVEVAEDGQAGWEALRLRSYDLLITDNEMPRLSGLELIKRLRSAGNTLPVVVASASFDADKVQCFDWLRVAAILKKPFVPEQLLETVRQVLRAATAVRKGGELFFPVLAEAFAHIEPAPRWGLNE